jgi:hypothetical protein
LVSCLGLFLSKNQNPAKAIGLSLLSSLLFFLITNFAFFYPQSAAVDLALGRYPHNMTGVKASYLAALPFFRNSVFGEVIFTYLFVGFFSMIAQLKTPKLSFVK